MDTEFNVIYPWRLDTLKTLLQGPYIDMHDYLFLLSLKNGEFDMESSETQVICKETTRQNEREEHYILKCFFHIKFITNFLKERYYSSTMSEDAATKTDTI